MSAVMPTYARFDLAFERGEGAYLFTEDGERYLDFAAGIAVVSLGHAHPHLVRVLQDQAAKLWHTSNLYRIPGQERLAERLAANSFAQTMFFANSGAEAVECAIKMARRYHEVTGNPERDRVITFTDAFHGRTLGTLAAGRQAKHMEGFDPVADGFDQVPFGNLNELRAAVTAQTAAIMVEPVQGEGSGYRVADAAFLQGLRDTCDEFGLLLIYDEIQCGMGRTGKMFAYEHSGVAPDIMPLAKGLGGGFPIGACLATKSAAQGLTAGTHGSTFGGNPLAVSVANGVLDVMLDDGFLDGVNRAAKQLSDGIVALVKKHPTVISGLRGVGLMIGIECVVSNTDLVARLHQRRLLCVGAGGNVVRFAPPLIIDANHINEALAILDAACADIEESGQ